MKRAKRYHETLKCSWCGKFIRYQDIADGTAYYIMIYPQSDLTEETYEGCCKRCNQIDGTISRI